MDEFSDPFSLLPRSRPSGLQTPDGREIRFIGPPPLAMNPKTNAMLAVAEFLDDPAVTKGFFYTLPEQLWMALIAKLGESQFDSRLLQIERRLSKSCGDHSSQVGFWHRQRVQYAGLRPLPEMSFTDDQIRSAGLDPLVVKHGIRTYNERDAVPLERFRRGYAGWLLTNKLFLDEHDALLTNHAQAVRQWGTHLAGQTIPSGHLLPGTDPNEDPRWQVFKATCEEFFARWRLQRLAGPYLPVPLQALMAGTFPWAVVQNLMGAGGVFFLPDTMPIPSRDELRGMLDHALHRGEKPEHLNEWFHIIRASSGARNQLDRFARLFEIQHYWRVLQARHDTALAVNTGRLETALSTFFEVSTNTLHADLIELRKRLGNEWLQRVSPV